jgi:hypothetical protein
VLVQGCNLAFFYTFLHLSQSANILINTTVDPELNLKQLFSNKHFSLGTQDDDSLNFPSEIGLATQRRLYSAQKLFEIK